MKQLIFISILILTCCLSTFAQANSVCPKIEINAPFDLIREGEKMKFSVSISNSAKFKLGYNWKISRGKIIDGQGKSFITIDTKDLGDVEINATVEITGLPANCINKFSQVGNVFKEKPLVTEPIDSYGKELSGDAESARLVNMILSLRQDTKAKGFIDFAVTNDVEMKYAKTHIKKIMRFLQSRGISRNRIEYQIRKDYSYRITLWSFYKLPKKSGEN